MIIGRRKLLASITAAALGRTAWGNWLRHAAVGPRNGFASSALNGTAAGQTSGSADLSKIGSHVYSEEGIPMFLGCENTAVAGVAPQTCEKSSDLNRKTSAAFEHYARQWLHLHPNAKAGDAAKLVEYLAGQDFTSGGLGANLE